MEPKAEGRALRGRSLLTDPRAAVAEATATWGDVHPALVLAFASTHQSAQGVFEALEERFPTSLIVGSSTSGEYLDGAHSNHGLVVAGLLTPSIRWAAVTLRGLATLTREDATTSVQDALAQLDLPPDALDPSRLVAMTFIDGLSKREEHVAALVADALQGVKLVGGSAGDDLAFKATHVIGPEGAFTDAAVVLIGSGEPGFFHVLKHQHFTTKTVQLAVTRADTANRIVYELDGYPAADAYAWAMGLSREQLTNTVTSLNPVTVTVQGEPYVRSVMQVRDDGALLFYCAVEEGWVLELTGHHDMVDALTSDLRTLGAKGKAPFFIAFNCILRSLEAEQRGTHDALKGALDTFANASIGFDTYGEQLNGLHINQTMVGVALWP